MKQKITDPVLAAAEQHIEAQLTPQNRQNYMKIVVAGMHAGLEGGPNSLIASLQGSKDPIADAAKGAVSLVFILRKQARGIMPAKAMVPAAMTLMIKALDFADKAGIAKVGRDELVRATDVFTDTIFKRMGISQKMIQHATMRVHGFIQDPAALEQIKRAAGVVRHPDASVPIDLPQAQSAEGEG